MTFGQEWGTNEKGHFVIPRDTAKRKLLFPEGVMEHPAKMQLLLAEEVIRVYSRPGDLVLDPFGGTGTTGVAALSGRPTTLIELEPIYLPLLEEFKAKHLNLPLTIHSGDARQVMKKLPADSFQLVLTSPPYANLLVGREKTEFTGQLAKMKAQQREYGADKAGVLNFGRLNPFMFQMAMRSIYKEIYRVLKPGGYYVSVTKDQMRAGERQFYSVDIIRYCNESGLDFTGQWWKWAPPGGMLQNVMKSKGSEVVEDEDCIVFQKGK